MANIGEEYNTIANNYKIAREKLDADFEKLTSSVTSISEELGKLSIPKEEHLGEKIQEAIGDITKNLCGEESGVISKINNLKDGADKFAQGWEDYYRSQYESWLANQAQASETPGQ